MSQPWSQNRQRGRTEGQILALLNLPLRNVNSIKTKCKISLAAKKAYFYDPSSNDWCLWMVNLSVYPSVCLFTCLYIYLQTYLCIHLFIYTKQCSCTFYESRNFRWHQCWPLLQPLSFPDNTCWRCIARRTPQKQP